MEPVFVPASMKGNPGMQMRYFGFVSLCSSFHKFSRLHPSQRITGGDIWT